MSKKVLFVVTSLGVGGIEKYLLRFVEFKKGQISPFVYCKGGKDGYLLNDFLKNNAIVYVRKIGWFNLFDYINFYRYLKGQKFQAVCDFTGNFSGLILLSAKIAGVSSRVVFYRESDYQFRKSFLKLVYANLCAYFAKRCATSILSNSRMALDNFYPGWEVDKKCKVIRNGIPGIKKLTKNEINFIKVSNNIPLNKIIVGHVGRYVAAKNHAQVLYSAERIIDGNDDVIFVMCGQGVKKGVEESAVYKRYKSKIYAYDNIENVLDFMQMFDVFLFPSISEGQPNALLEALCIGIPFVASDIPSVKECVPNELHKFLVPVDQRDDFHLAIERLLRNKFCMKDVSIWAINEYDSTKLFDGFFNELIK